MSLTGMANANSKPAPGINSGAFDGLHVFPKHGVLAGDTSYLDCLGTDGQLSEWPRRFGNSYTHSARPLIDYIGFHILRFHSLTSNVSVYLAAVDFMAHSE